MTDDDVNQRLAAALTEVGLDDMAKLALRGHYHDFQSTLATPAMQLASDLAEHAQRASQAGNTDLAAKIMALRDRHVHEGEFDA